MPSSDLPATPAASAEKFSGRTPPPPVVVRTGDKAEKGDRWVMPQIKPEALSWLALGLAALGLALIGQFYFIKVRDDFRDGLLFYAAAIVLFVILVRQAEAAGEGPSLAARARMVVD